MIGAAATALWSEALRAQDTITWTHLSSANGDLEPPTATGTEQTAALVFDVDLDGVDDFVLSERTDTPSLIWYRRHSSGWTRIGIDHDRVRIEAGGHFYDIDGDGDLDIAHGADASQSFIWWWENPYPDYDPAVPWTRRVLKSTGGTKHHDIQFGDVDGDGRAELVAWNQYSHELLLIEIPDDPRNHVGEWPRSVVATVTDRYWEGLAIEDIDLDGTLDIAGAAHWWRHTGGGAFEQFTIDPTPGREFTRTVVGQLVPGGRPEVVIAPGDNNGPVDWFQWDGSQWVKTVLNKFVYRPHSVQIVDMDQDGHLDIFMAEMGIAGRGPLATSWVYYGDGTGNFREEVVSVGVANHESRVADLDGDGDYDILSKPYNYLAPRVDVFLNAASPVITLDSWERHVIDPARPYRAIFVLPADLDGDGYPDVASGGWWYQNPGTAGGSWTRHTFGEPLNNVALLADLDEDGDVDALGTQGIANIANANFAWAENDGTGGFTIHANIPNGNGDFLQGALVDRFVAGGPLEVILSWHNGGDGLERLVVPADPVATTWTREVLSTVTEQEQISSGDIDGDGDPDLLLGKRWLRNDAGTWSRFTLQSTLGEPDRNRLIDVDGDGDLDAVIGYESLGSLERVAWYERPADPTATWPQRIIDEIIGPLSVDTGDLDRDGDVDVVAGEHNYSDEANSALYVYENGAGDGTSWVRHVVHVGDEHHDGSQLVDIDLDGDLDIISIGWTHSRVLLYENQGSSGGGPLNNPPVVDAGLRQSIYLPDTALLEGSVADDGLPFGTLTVHWSQDEGPATAGIAQPSQPSTVVSFPATGTYVLRLTADDGEFERSDTVTIDVFPAGGSDRVVDGIVALWEFGEGAGTTVHDTSGVGAPLDLTISDLAAVTWESGSLTVDTSTLITSPAPATKIIQAATASDELTVEAWVTPGNLTQTGPARIVTISATPLHRNFTLGQGSGPTSDLLDARLRTTTTSNNGTPSISSSPGSVTAELLHATYTRDASGAARLYIDGIEVASSTVGGDLSAWDPDFVMGLSNEATGDRPWVGTFHLVAVYGRALAHAEILQNYQAGPEPDPGPTPLLVSVDALTTLDTSPPLSGTVNDDAATVQVTIGYSTWDADNQGDGTWALADGVISPPLAVGVYDVEVLATAGSETAVDGTVDELVIEALPPVNEAPTVDAGADLAVTLPAAASLTGSASDDGLPDPPGALSTTWSVVGDPTGIVIQSPASLATTVTFPAEGTYVLRLQAFDGELSTTDDVTVTVLPQPIEPQPPVVDAGSPQVVVLPSGALLDATVTDDGLPDPPGALTSTWSQTAGPEDASIAAPLSVDTTVSFTAAGDYEFEIAVFDGQFTVTDRVAVTVLPEPVEPQPPIVDAGSPQVVVLPAEAFLDATVVDDGLPDPPGALTSTWSQTAGPEDASIAAPLSVDTTVSFIAAGDYEFEIEVFDGQFTVTDRVAVTVESAPPPPPPGTRVTEDLLALWTFDEATGSVVHDVSGVGSPIDLTIESPTATTWNDGSLSVDAPTIIRSGEAPAKIHDAVVASGEISVEAWITTTDLEQDGPARILTISDGSLARNLTLGQGRWGTLPSEVVDVRLRTSTSSANGTPSLTTPAGSLTAELTHVVFTREADGTARTYIDGVEVASTTLGGTLETWDDSYLLGLANEIGASRPWLGTFDLVAIYGRALLPDEVTQNLDAGPDGDTPPDDLTVSVDPLTTDDPSPPLTGSVSEDGTMVVVTVDGGSYQAVDLGGGRWLIPGDVVAPPLDPGVYDVSVTADAGDGRVASDDTLDELTIVPPAPTNEPPLVAAGPDRAVEIPQLATLDGTVSDDGLPDPPGSLTITWRQLTGPAAAAISSPSTPDTDVGFSEAGDYTFELEAYDGEFRVVDTVQVAVTAPPANQPPAVEAGPALLVELPDSALLDGTVTDDGLPDPPATLVIVWRQLDGPATSDIASPSTPDTEVLFTLGGDYTFELEAYDGEFRVVDTVQVTVTDPPPPVNEAPLVEAGPDRVVELPASALLDATVSDDGLPDPPGALTMSWRRAVGPDTATIVSPSSVDTEVLFSETGAYTFELEAYDGEFRIVDTVQVTVSDAPPPPPDDRVTDGLLALYTFEATSGDTVADVSGVGSPLDLTILDPSAVVRSAGHVTVTSPTTITSGVAATKIHDAVIASGGVTMEAWVRSSDLSQDGPARILTLSPSPFQRNATLGQGTWGTAPTDTFDARLRTTTTSLNGQPSITSPAGSCTGGLQHVVYTRGPDGTVRLYVDGVLAAEATRAGDLSGWNRSYPLCLANEPSQNRPWVGELHLAAIYGRALTPDEVTQNRDAGPDVTTGGGGGGGGSVGAVGSVRAAAAPGGLSEPVDEPPRRGDCNEDGTLSISDAVATLDHLFGVRPVSACPAACDSSGDGAVRLDDALLLVEHLFRGGPPPAPGATGCGDG